MQLRRIAKGLIEVITLAAWAGIPAAQAAPDARVDEVVAAPAAATSVAAGSLLPATIAPRVGAERALAVTTVGYDGARGSATLEADNLTDAKAFDNYGVQRPGRAFYLELTADI